MSGKLIGFVQGDRVQDLLLLVRERAELHAQSEENKLTRDQFHDQLTLIDTRIASMIEFSMQFGVYDIVKIEAREHPSPLTPTEG